MQLQAPSLNTQGQVRWPKIHRLDLHRRRYLPSISTACPLKTLFTRNPLKQMRSFFKEGSVESTNSLLIRTSESSDAGVADHLFSSLYSELHRLAKRELARQWAPISLSVTTLLHEAYLDMAKGSDPLFPDRARFMGYAARVMRGLIIDHARNPSAIKRGGKL